MYLCHIAMYVHAIQVKECKNDVNVPSITKTSGSFHGAQYRLTELLMEHAEIEVCSYIASYTCSYDISHIMHFSG